MLEITFALVIVTFVCLALESTRLYGVLGLALLFFMYPMFFTALLILGGVAAAVIHYRNNHYRNNQRSNENVLPRLPE